MAGLTAERTLYLNQVEVHMSERRAGVLAFILKGEIDISNAANLLQLFTVEAEKRKRDVEIDLSCTTYIDSSGMTVLIEMQKRAVRDGSRLEVLIDGNERLHRLFKIAGLNRVLNLR